MLYVDKHALPVAQEALPVASGGAVPVGAHGHDYPVAGEALPVAGALRSHLGAFLKHKSFVQIFCIMRLCERRSDDGTANESG